MSKILETEQNDNKVQNNKFVSEYKIGHTTYIVELHFNFERGETLDGVIQRLINREVGAIA